MIHFPELQPGVIVKITEYDYKPCRAFARIKSPETNEEWAMMNVVSGKVYTDDNEILWLGSDDKWAVIPLDEVPDKIMAKIAQLMLTGEV